MYSPKEIAQNYLATGLAKINLPAPKMLLMGIIAGMFIALAGVGATVAPATFASPSLAKFVSALVFPAALAMVLIAGSELFTGNCMLIIPVLEKQATVFGMLKNWFFVYFGNFIGCALIALIVVNTSTFSLFDNAVAGSVIHTAVVKVNLGFGSAILSGILCNFLVCIAVWMAYAAKDVVGKIAGLFLPIMVFVISGYEHSIANMYYISAGLFAKNNLAYFAAAPASDNISSLTWGAFLGRNLVPVTIGNIIGGMVLVGLVYWLVYLRGGDKHAAATAGAKGKKR